MNHVWILFRETSLHVDLNLKTDRSPEHTLPSPYVEDYYNPETKNITDKLHCMYGKPGYQ